MSSATMPTKPAAIHSIASMKRSIGLRVMPAPGHYLSMISSENRCPLFRIMLAVTTSKRRREFPTAASKLMSKRLLRQGVVFGERGLQLRHGGVRIDAGLLDAIGPGLEQRFGCLLPQRRLL